VQHLTSIAGLAYHAFELRDPPSAPSPTTTSLWSAATARSTSSSLGSARDRVSTAARSTSSNPSTS